MPKQAMTPEFTGPEELRTELFHLLANDSRAVDLVLQHCFDGVFYWDLKDFSRQFVGPKFWEMLGIDADSAPPERSGISARFISQLEGGQGLA